MKGLFIAGYDKPVYAAFRICRILAIFGRVTREGI
jgi:hypothetical protein